MPLVIMMDIGACYYLYLASIEHARKTRQNLAGHLLVINASTLVIASASYYIAYFHFSIPGVHTWFGDGAIAVGTVLNTLAWNRSFDESDGLSKAPEIGSAGLASSNLQVDQRRKVFLMHGRNETARTAMVHFLRALRLEPFGFEDVAASLGSAPFVADVVLQGVRSAQISIAIFTPDEYAGLRPSLNEGVPQERWQSRPNVVFEAGLAFGMDRAKTILVTIGSEVELFSDLSGLHIVRLDNKYASRRLLVQKLKSSGCDLVENVDYGDPATCGDFEGCVDFAQTDVPFRVIP